MLTKIVALLQTKAAVAVLGAVLVSGAGTAAAVTVTTHEIPFTQIHVGTSSEGTPGANNDGEHHNEVGIEGVLKAYDATALTISVETTDHNVDATATSATATTDHETDTKAATTTATTTTTVTVTVNANTRVNGDHAKSLADLTANIGHKVQVQAEKQSDGTFVASKVTVSNDVPDTNGQNNDKHGEGTPGAQNTGGQGGGNSQNNETHDASGTISAVGADFFQITLRDGGKTLTVSVSAATTFSGTAHNLGDLKVGYNVDVKGTLQSNGTLAATSVSAEAVGK